MNQLFEHLKVVEPYWNKEGTGYYLQGSKQLAQNSNCRQLSLSQESKESTFVRDVAGSNPDRINTLDLEVTEEKVLHVPLILSANGSTFKSSLLRAIKPEALLAS